MDHFSTQFHAVTMPTLGYTRFLYSRITSISATAGGGQTRLISAGVTFTDWFGAFWLDPATANKGNIFRITAWGRWSNDTLNQGTVRVRMFFTAATGTPPLAVVTGTPMFDTQPNLDVGIQGDTPWWLEAYVTIRNNNNAQDNTICEGFIENVTDYPTDFNDQSPRVVFGVDFINPAAVSFELTADVNTAGTFTLDQASIEWMQGI